MASQKDERAEADAGPNGVGLDHVSVPIRSSVPRYWSSVSSVLDAMSIEFRCPNCQSLIYSRKPKTCGQCGVSLPPELLLTQEQACVLHEQRQGARKLADAFGRQGPRAESSGQSDLSRQSSVLRPSSPEAMQSGVDFAYEFRCRKRTGFWLYVVGYSLILVPVGFISAVLGGIPLAAWLPLIGFVALACCSAWRRAAPVCPNCQQNIRLCPAVHCHLCGEQLSGKRCLRCGVDYSWTGWFRPYANGLARWITYCPSCGVHLASWVRRWRGDRWR